ncbi:MAG: hypothetical protein ABL872_07225 [Lacibacter sp.]
MKNRPIRYFVFIVGILAYSFLYVATKKTSLPCDEKGYTYQKETIITEKLHNQPGYSYHSLTGKNCDTLVVWAKDSVFNYEELGDSACVAAKKAQVIIKGTIVERWNSQTGKNDTLAIRFCP